jgi:hypothetical protein
MTQTEKTIFEKEGLKITNVEVTQGYDLYPVADITAVELRKLPGSPAGGIVLLVLGAATFCFGFTTDAFGSGCEYIPVLLVLGGAALLATRSRDAFQVFIQRGEKMTKIFTTREEALAWEIEAALQTVIPEKPQK